MGIENAILLLVENIPAINRLTSWNDPNHKFSGIQGSRRILPRSIQGLFANSHYCNGY